MSWPLVNNMQSWGLASTWTLIPSVLSPKPSFRLRLGKILLICPENKVRFRNFLGKTSIACCGDSVLGPEEV